MKRYILKPLGYLLGFVLIVVLLAAGGGLAFRSYKQNALEAATRIETENGIESLERVTLNGSKQWIYLRGQDQGNPVLLFVHGGPGSPEMPAARHMGLKLEEHFTVVHWDQRASGKSRREDYNDVDLTVATYVDDLVALTNLLRERFHQDKIYLIGHSWGSVIGVLAVRDNPGIYHAYIGMGQVVDMVRNEEISLDYVRTKAEDDGNLEAIQQLAHLDPPYAEDPQQLMIQRQWLHTYGGAMRGMDYGDLLKIIAFSPEYSLLDLAALVDGSVAVAVRMWPELSRVDFMTQAPSLDVPVYFFVGRHDYNTPFELAEEYYQALEAPSKELIWFENSAHMMNLSAPDFYQDTLIEKVLAETQAREADE